MLLIAVECLKTPCSLQDLDSKKISKVSGRQGRSVLNCDIILKTNKVKARWRPPISEIAISRKKNRGTV